MKFTTAAAVLSSENQNGSRDERITKRLYKHNYDGSDTNPPHRNLNFLLFFFFLSSCNSLLYCLRCSDRIVRSKWRAVNRCPKTLRIRQPKTTVSHSTSAECVLLNKITLKTRIKSSETLKFVFDPFADNRL